jgi:hypothetical protein
VAHADLVQNTILVTTYVALIVVLAFFVGWEYERSRKRRDPGRYRALFRDAD